MVKGKSPAPKKGKGRSSADRAERGQRDREGSAHTNGGYDEAAVKEAIRALLRTVGENPERDGLVNTPGRTARSFGEIFAGLCRDPVGMLGAKFEIGHQEMIIVKDIPFCSTREHRLLPFHGHAHIAYIPNVDGKVTGLSETARLVDRYTRRPQVQERIATQVAKALENCLGTGGVLIVIEAEHIYVSMHGVNKSGSRTVTLAVHEVLRNQATRSEALSLIQG